MPKNFVYIVASLHGRSGKTLFSRLLADYLILQGATPEIFDTDTVEKTLASYFPGTALAIDIDKVINQMQLFDAMIAPTDVPRVVDVSHQSFSKFFKLMQETGFLEESRERDIEPVIFYIVQREADSYAQGLSLREHFRDCSFVVVENEHNGHADRTTQARPDYRTLMSHDLKLHLPALDPMFASVIDDPYLSLSGFMQNPPAGMPPGRVSLAYMSLEARNAIRGWLKKVNEELHRKIETVRLRAEMMYRRPL